MAAEFTHLHLHTDYSLLDGACDVDKLAAHLSKIGQTAAAMTDHGNIYGAVHFFDAMQKKGLKPILGCELYICKNEDHRGAPEGDTYNHLLVLAENEAGYRNLVRLTSEAALHGFYRKPRVSKNFLAKHSEGLIGFSGCLAGEVNQHLMAGKYDEAKRTAGFYQDLFGKGNFFLEIQDHDLAPDKAVCEALFKMERELDIPLIATNDSHYVAADDSRAHEILLCVQTAGSMNDPKRFKFDTQEFYIKSAEEMLRTFSQTPEVCTRTMQFVDRCNLKMVKVDNPFPDFAVPEGETLDSYFERVCREGLEMRLNTAVAHLRQRGILKKTIPEYHARLDLELAVIKQMKFPGYFMIVWDFIRYAREHNIPVGPGRGSAAGSLVAYVMQITDIDPLQNELLFERFLNPERISMPDIDIDFCMNRRGEVIDYVTRKYGRDQVAQIITFNTMAAKAAIKDVGRALDMPYGEVDRIAKMIPTTIGITIEQALEDSPHLATAYEDPKIKELIDAALRLEGLVRGAGVHAAGVVIAPKPLTELVPVTRAKNDDIVTAYDMKAVEKMGLLKMDFLGLTTLTDHRRRLKLIKATGVEIDLDNHPARRPRDLRKGLPSRTHFGRLPVRIRRHARRSPPLQAHHRRRSHRSQRPLPSRPDPGRHDRRLHRAQVGPPRRRIPLPRTRAHPARDPRRHRLPGAGHADQLRHRWLLPRRRRPAPPRHGQKRSRRDGQAARHLHGRSRRAQVPQRQSRPALRPHGAVRRIRLQQVALRRLRAPRLPHRLAQDPLSGRVHGRAAHQRNLQARQRRQVHLRVPRDEHPRRAAQRPGLRRQLHPHVTPTASPSASASPPSRTSATTPSTPSSRARAELRAAGKQGFASLWEFCEKVDLRLLNKRVLESLIKAGAMDAFGSRAQLTAALDKAMERAQKTQRDEAAGQHGLFGIFDSDLPACEHNNEDALPSVAEWDEHTRLQNEKEVLGFFVSGHPMDKYREKLRNMKVVDTATAVEMKPEPQVFRRRGEEPQNEISIAGVITGLKVAKSKRSGELYAQAVLEDTVGKIELIAFSTSYEKLKDKLKIDVPVVVRGVLRGEEDSAPKLSVSNIQALEDVKIKLPDSLRIKVPLHNPDTALLEKIHAVFLGAPGKGKVLLDLEEPGEFCAVLEPHNIIVAADRLFIDHIEELVGRGGVRVLD